MRNREEHECPDAMRSSLRRSGWPKRPRPGQASLSVRAVAKEAGIGASTLRHYFPTQSDLHEAIARGSMDVAVKDFSIDDSSLDPAERLFECCAQFLPTHEHRDMQLELWFTMHMSALGPDRRERVPHDSSSTGTTSPMTCLHRWLGILADEGHIDSAEVATVFHRPVHDARRAGSALDRHPRAGDCRCRPRSAQVADREDPRSEELITSSEQRPGGEPR